jgi:hypothetical protein
VHTQCNHINHTTAESWCHQAARDLARRGHVLLSTPSPQAPARTGSPTPLHTIFSRCNTLCHFP